MVYSPTTVTHLFARSPQERVDIQALTSAQNQVLGSMELGLERGPRRVRGFRAQNVAEFGAKWGYFKRSPGGAKVVAVFVTKGGVLKTSLTLNLARMAALHGLKTCVIGLDMQCDITTALGVDGAGNENTDMDTHISESEITEGLYDVFARGISLKNLIRPTNLPTLSLIPETPELVILEKMLFQKSRRESWLLDAIVAPLRDSFDLILFDCSPNWNLLTTNALMACDVLFSPLECKINNYRNFKMFEGFMGEFRHELRLSFKHIYVPTKLNAQRKLSREIYSWYLENVKNVVPFPLRESTAGEEAIASSLSTPEYAPGTPAAYEMNQILSTFWQMAATESADLPTHSSDIHLEVTT